MFSLHNVYVVTLISQTTSAMLLFIPGFSDRRVRGVVPLAVACSLHALAIALMPHWRLANHWVPEAISALTLPLIFLLIHQGPQALTPDWGSTPR